MRGSSSNAGMRAAIDAPPGRASMAPKGWRRLSAISRASCSGKEAILCFCVSCFHVSVHTTRLTSRATGTRRAAAARSADRRLRPLRWRRWRAVATTSIAAQSSHNSLGCRADATRRLQSKKSNPPQDLLGLLFHVLTPTDCVSCFHSAELRRDTVFRVARF